MNGMIYIGDLAFHDCPSLPFGTSQDGVEIDTLDCEGVNLGDDFDELNDGR